MARKEGRIGRVARDPLMAIRLFFDIGGTGAKADACAIWVSQFVGKEIRHLDYYEAQGQPLEAHVTWLRANGYGPDKASIWLPHDGATKDKVYAVSYESALRAAGYTVSVIPNQGAGAAMARIEACRRLFPAMWFDSEKCQAGLDALSWYHERRDEARGIGLGPEHDWASHCADAIGLLAVAYKPPSTVKAEPIAFASW
jgi:phage terminase large subunit